MSLYSKRSIQYNILSKIIKNILPNEICDLINSFNVNYEKDILMHELKLFILYKDYKNFSKDELAICAKEQYTSFNILLKYKDPNLHIQLKLHMLNVMFISHINRKKFENETINFIENIIDILATQISIKTNIDPTFIIEINHLIYLFENILTKHK